MIGLFIIYTGLKRYLTIQKIEDMPTSKVGSASAGLVKLSGTAQPRESGKSPVNGVPSVFWRVTGEYYKKRGKGKGWRIFYSAQHASAFYIADDTGRMLVMPEGAQINIPSHSSYKGYISADWGWFASHTTVTMPEPGLKFIASLDINSRENFLAHKDEEIRMNEYIIRDGDPLFVLGTVTPVDDASGQQSPDTLILRKGSYDPSMYIADSGEGYLIHNLSFSLYLRIFGGLALSAASLFLMLILRGV
jgi:hypothetical protein